MYHSEDRQNHRKVRKDNFIDSDESFKLLNFWLQILKHFNKTLFQSWPEQKESTIAELVQTVQQDLVQDLVPSYIS